MLRKLPFRTRVVAVVSVPLFVLAGLAGAGILGQRADLQTQQRYGTVAPAFSALRDTAGALEAEAVVTSWYVASGRRDADAARQLETVQATTDGSVANLSRARVVVDAAGDGEITRRYSLLLQSLAKRTDLRREAVSGRADAVTTARPYVALAGDVLDMEAALVGVVQDRGLAQSLLGVVELGRQTEASAHAAVVYVDFLATGHGAYFGEWVVASAAEAGHEATFLGAATTAERATLEAARATDAPVDPARPSDGVIPSSFPVAPVSVARYVDVFRAKQQYFGAGIAAVQEVVDKTAVQDVDQARSAALVYGFGASAVIILGLLLVWALLRSVDRPLRDLTEAARHVSEHALPQLLAGLQDGGSANPAALTLTPIDVGSDDELAELAGAFNAIQQVAVRVAEEQADLLRKGVSDLFVNLARRNQSLLDRQIGLLDDLERQTEDADHLSALFSLDHLATRMRRNAENLLVMAGSEQPRQLREAVPIIDVVRAAASEITDFSRVAFYGFDDTASLSGHAVSDVTHLLAELLENATSLSPPGTPVVVAVVPAERRFVIAITDEGIGMDDERLSAANALLAHPPAPGLAMSRQLGLLVVGHLSARHGISVQLRRAANRGITAVVSLPAMVISRVERKQPRMDVVTERVVAEPVAPTPAVMDPQPARPRMGDAQPPRPAQPRPRPANAPLRADNPDAAPMPGPPPAPAAPAPLTQRVPGQSLTHQPSAPGSDGGGAAPPEPERVHQLLTQHLRGIRDGSQRGPRGEDATAGDPQRTPS